MIEPTITAEDLTLYALGLLEGDEQAHVESMLRKSTAAREELASIRGDLALMALSAEQHTPPALTRQRLLKQVARERRTVPVEVPIHDNGATSPNTFRVDREAPDLDRTDSRQKPTPSPQRNEQALADSLSDPVPHGSPMQPRRIETRTFPRAQQARPLPTPRQVPPSSPSRLSRETEALSLEAVESFSAAATSFVGESVQLAADQTFAPDPQVFPREARSLATSATAHSVTMFEQHFAAETSPNRPEPTLSPDPEAYSGRRRAEPLDALAGVQDTFVPSAAARDDDFGFSSYRDRDPEDTQGGGFARLMGWAGWAVAAAVAVAAVFTLRDDFNLREQVSQQQSSLSATEASAARADTVLQTLQSASTQHFHLAATDAAQTPSGRVAYLPERGTLVFQGSNLETLQPYKTYELWLIPAGQGRQPVPAGLFKPDAHGYATIVLPQLPKGLVAANFGVTIEDEGGSGTPTLPILLVGQQS